MVLTTAFIAVTISIDTTFKVSAKAKVTDKAHGHSKPMKGGVFSGVNEHSQIMTWRLCQTKANIEMEKALLGVSRRFEVLDIPPASSLTADDCCHVRTAVERVMPMTPTILDVFHFRERYGAAIINGRRNPLRNNILNDVTESIIKTRAQDGRPATYHNQTEQLDRLRAMYEKYERIGGVWSQASAQIHQDQMNHVRKGCLVRPREDVASDGSRIEGSHKQWNAIMRTHSSGIEVFVALAHDFVLRRNLRIANTLEPTGDPKTAPASFIASTFGSYHILLVDHVAAAWNALSEATSSSSSSQPALSPRPRLKIVDSGESFGLVCAPFDKRLDLDLVKEEDTGELPLDVFDNLKIDPRLFSLSAALAADSQDNKTSGPSMAAPSPPLPLTATHPAIVEVSAVAAVRTRVVAAAEIMDLTGEGDADTLESPPGPSNHDTLADTARAPSKRKAASHDLALEQDEPAPKRVCTVKGVPSMALAGAPGASGATVSPLIEAYFKSRVSTHAPGGSPASMSDVAAKSVGPQAHGTLPAPAPSNAIEESPSGASMPAADSQCRCTSASAPVLDVHEPPPPLAALTPSHLDRLAQLLPPPSIPGLTRSQALFAKATGVDPRSLEIEVKEEFWAFMDMRARHQWATVRMTTREIVLAVDILHVELMKRAIYVAKKQPGTLLEKLAKIEDTIIRRVLSDNYKAANGTDTFWRRHCPAVPLGKAVEPAENSSSRKTKSMRCSRCHQLKYPGPGGAPQNHKREFCSDGVKTIAVKGGSPSDKPPPWPQPHGIFTDGVKFDPVVFLQHLRGLYDRIIVQREPGNDAMLPMEDRAFAQMAKERITLLPDGGFAFKLFAHTALAPAMAEHVATGDDGWQYLRVACLSDSKPPPALAD